MKDPLTKLVKIKNKIKCFCSCHSPSNLWCSKCAKNHQILISELCREAVKFSHLLEYL